jgi:hypothetical protein
VLGESQFNCHVRPASARFRRAPPGAFQPLANCTLAACALADVLRPRHASSHPGWPRRLSENAREVLARCDVLRDAPSLHGGAVYTLRRRPFTGEEYTGGGPYAVGFPDGCLHLPCDPGGPYAVVRDLAVPAWSDIADNFPAPTAGALAPLFRPGWQPQSGRLFLWRGEPGAGKTHAVQALIRAWRDWCSAHVILDPERFFGSETSYMLEVLVAKGHSDDDAASARPQWRLLI